MSSPWGRDHLGCSNRVCDLQDLHETKGGLQGRKRRKVGGGAARRLFNTDLQDLL